MIAKWCVVTYLIVVAVCNIAVHSRNKESDVAVVSVILNAALITTICIWWQ